MLGAGLRRKAAAKRLAQGQESAGRAQRVPSGPGDQHNQRRLTHMTPSEVFGASQVVQRVLKISIVGERHHQRQKIDPATMISIEQKRTFGANVCRSRIRRRPATS
jgi:hypothetical protein